MKILKHLRPIQWLAFLTLITTLIAAPFGAQARPKSSGISGQILLHNRLVASLRGQSEATGPFRASFQIYSATTSAFINSATTDSMGRFEVELPSGDYLVVPDTLAQGRVLQPGEMVIGPYEQAAPVQVRVRKHHFTRLTIIYEECMGN